MLTSSIRCQSASGMSRNVTNEETPALATEAVQGPDRFFGLVHGSANRLPARHVEHGAETAHFLRDSSRGILVDVGDGDFEGAFREQLGSCLADAARSSGDQHAHDRTSFSAG